MSIPEITKTLRGRDDGDDTVGFHQENLFDQDEDGSGNTIDARTGLPFDNSTDEGLDGLSVVEDKKLVPRRLGIEALKGAGDAADIWLQKHDPDY